jgi:hypothetical protein
MDMMHIGTFNRGFQEVTWTEQVSIDNKQIDGLGCADSQAVEIVNGVNPSYLILNAEDKRRNRSR